MIPFSTLLSVYHKEDPRYLEQALMSIEDQTLLPSEIVLVKDGPLTEALEAAIQKHVDRSKIPYVLVELEKNMGLGEALMRGLEACQYAWVARMDTDDIALSERFEKQAAYLRRHPDTDILGGWICEFDEDPAHCQRERRVPPSHEKIVRFAKYRCPLNHMTVFFRKEAVLDAGGYLPMHGFEDYYLWMRMLQKGKRFANLAEVLVKARAGREMIARRQGWQYATNEWQLEKAAYKMGYWSRTDLARNLFVRILPRLLPQYVVQKVYNQLRKIQ